MACGAQRALLPVAVGTMNIHDVRNRQRDVRRASSLNAPTLGAGHNKRIKGFTLLLTLFWLTGIFHRKEIYFVKK